MKIEDIEKEFELFYRESPFVNLGPKFKLAMLGSYIAGYTLCGNEFLKIADKK